MKSCELCKSPARINCDSDQASLCWTCDNKVHSANFLVARHSRSLLCRVCQSPTPWTSSGEKLVPSAVSVCEKCTSEEEDVGTEESHEEIEDDGDENEVEEEDLQVVPLCTTPPPAASSCSSDAFSNGGGGVMMKRRRDVADEGDVDCISARKNRRRATFYEFLPPNSEEIAGDAYKSVVVELDLN